MTVEKIRSLYSSSAKKLDRTFQTDVSTFISGGFWTVAARILSSLLLFFLSLLYARFISKDLYGTYRYIISALGIGGFLTFDGIRRSFYISASRGNVGDIRRGIKINFLLSFLITLFGFCIATYFYIIGNPVLFWGFLIAALLSPLEKGTGAFANWFILQKQFFRKAFATFAENIFFVLVMSGVVFWIYTEHPSPAAALAAVIIGYFLGHGIPSTYYYIKTLREIPQDPATPIKPHIMYGLHLSGGDILGSIATYIDGILLYAFLGPQALANYSFAIVGPEQAKGLILTIASLAAPKIYSKNHDDLAHLPKKLARFAIVITIGILLYIVSAPFIYAVFFPKYTNVVSYSQIYIISLIAIPFSAILDFVVSSSGKLKNIYTYKIGSPLFQTLFLCTLIPFFGIWGAIIGRMIGKFFDALILFYIFQKP